jgi:hypothetical protein
MLVDYQMLLDFRDDQNEKLRQLEAALEAVREKVICAAEVDDRPAKRHKLNNS